MWQLLSLSFLLYGQKQALPIRVVSNPNKSYIDDNAVYMLEYLKNMT